MDRKTAQTISKAYFDRFHHNQEKAVAMEKGKARNDLMLRAFMLADEAVVWQDIAEKL